MVHVEAVVAYAHKVSATTFAPFGFTLGMPLRGSLAPNPQEEQLRSAKLHAFNGETLTLPFWAQWQHTLVGFAEDRAMTQQLLLRSPDL